ncbi:MAG: alpha-ketoglutarate-dependent dioxygenase AlkB [Myxococcota bacterium]
MSSKPLRANLEPAPSRRTTSRRQLTCLALGRHHLTNRSWVELLQLEIDERYWSRVLEETSLNQEKLRIFGREVQTPRLTGWYGEPGCSYSYSGRRFSPKPWTSALSELRERVESHTRIQFNSVLVNYYRDGNDSMGEHADKEPELGPSAPDNVLIASLSLGSPRRFLLRTRDKTVNYEMRLGNGSLLVMGGATQIEFVHAVPKTKQRVGPRLNLTFRIVVEPQPRQHPPAHQTSAEA